MIEESNGLILLNVLRPIGVEGIDYSFDITSEPSPWESTRNLAHDSWVDTAGNGMEIFRLRLSGVTAGNWPKLLVRLRAALVSTVE